MKILAMNVPLRSSLKTFVTSGDKIEITILQARMIKSSGVNGQNFY